MAATATQSCPACDCSDSPLSVVANVLSVLTFALGLFAYFAAFTAVTRGAAKGVEDTREILVMTQQQIAQTRQLLKVLQNRADPDLGMMRSLVGDSLQALVAAKKDMDDLLSEFDVERKESKTGSAGLSVSLRLRWWYYEKEMAVGMTKLRSFSSILRLSS